MSGAIQDQFLENGRFQVDIQKCPQSSPLCVSASVDPIRVKIDDVTSGADFQQRLYKPMWTGFGEARFTFRVPQSGQNQDVKDWFNLCRTSPNGNRSSISIIIKDRANNEARRYNLQECFPTYYSAGSYSTDTATQLCELHVNVGRIEIA
jgi:hypothetical protein